MNEKRPVRTVLLLKKTVCREDGKTYGYTRPNHRHNTESDSK